jgi:RNA polymerase sigma-70 factor, ECF subfamily
VRTELLAPVETCNIKSVEPNELVRRIQAGCNDSATELSNRYMPRLLILLERRLNGRRADAEDIAQESFAKAFQELDRFDFQYRFSTWLYTIAIRRAIDFLRSEKRKPHSESIERLDQIPSNASRALAENADEGKNIWSIARTILVESQYSALWLKYGEGLSVQEIATVLQKTQIGIRVNLHRARTKLSKELHRRDRELVPHSKSSKTSPS